MKWKDRFARAKKRRYFTPVDANAAGSERHSPFGERAYDMGYRHDSHCYPQLFRAVYAFDWKLANKMAKFTTAIRACVGESNTNFFGMYFVEAENAYKDIMEHEMEPELESRIDDNIAYTKRWGRR